MPPVLTVPICRSTYLSSAPMSLSRERRLAIEKEPQFGNGGSCTEACSQVNADGSISLTACSI